MLSQGSMFFFALWVTSAMSVQLRVKYSFTITYPKFLAMKILSALIFTLLLLSACENEEVTPVNQLEGWEGEYFTVADELETILSPLRITPDGELFIANAKVPYTFDEASQTLTVSEPTTAFSAMQFILETHGDNKFFSGEITTNSEGDLPVVGSIVPHAVWFGEYQTETNFWGGFFSPLVISKDGSVTVAGDTVTLDLDQEEMRISFDWTDIKTTTAKATFVMDDDMPAESFAGAINPRRQDGPVSFRGSMFTTR